MEAFWDGLGTMFALIGLGIAIDIVFNDGDNITKTIRAIREKVK